MERPLSFPSLKPRAAAIVLLVAIVYAHGQSVRDMHVPENASPDSILVVGFLGGLEGWNNPHRAVRQVALALQAEHIPHLSTATIENRHQDLALDVIRRFVGSRRQVVQPRLILYGQSLGGAAVIHIARSLAASDISVYLTIQVDSVGFDNALVPPNVRYAANLFQSDPFTINGRSEIAAQDPRATHILENTQLSYLFRPYSTLNESDSSWMRRTFGGSHAKMELDTAVWAHVRDLIRKAVNGNL